MLTALPNLQRERPSRAGRAVGAGSSDASGPKGDDDSEAVAPDEVIGPPAQQRRTSSSRPTAPYRPQAKQSPYADMSVAEIRAAMKRLDDRERYLPLFVGPVLVALDLLLTAVAIHDNPALHHKNHADPGLILAVGIGSAVIALLVVISAFFRRRSFTIFSLLFGGYGGGLVTMIPAWILAGWLFVRFNRLQKALIAKTGGPAAARQASSQARTQRLEQRRRNLEERRRTGRRTPPVAEGPASNKRYTPPRPTTPRPKP